MIVGEVLILLKDRKSWKKLCEELENTSDASRLRELLSIDPDILMITEVLMKR